METPDITAAQKITGPAVGAIVLAVLASPGSDLVKCFALAVVGALAVAVVIADAMIRRGRASIEEAAQYATPADAEGA